MHVERRRLLLMRHGSVDLKSRARPEPEPA
jgi:hypothetical protein